MQQPQFNLTEVLGSLSYNDGHTAETAKQIFEEELKAKNLKIDQHYSGDGYVISDSDGVPQFKDHILIRPDAFLKETLKAKGVAQTDYEELSAIKQELTAIKNQTKKLDNSKFMAAIEAIQKDQHVHHRAPVTLNVATAESVEAERLQMELDRHAHNERVRKGHFHYNKSRPTNLKD